MTNINKLFLKAVVSPPPHAQASVYPTPPPTLVPGGRGGTVHTRLRERGWGESPNSDEGTNTMVTLGTNEPCAGDPQHQKIIKSVVGGGGGARFERNNFWTGTGCLQRHHVDCGGNGLLAPRLRAPTQLHETLIRRPEKHRFFLSCGSFYSSVVILLYIVY